MLSLSILKKQVTFQELLNKPTKDDKTYDVN